MSKKHARFIGLTIDDKEYYYIRDITGNINKIVDTSNTVMIEYTYDAWGKPNICINNELSTSLLEEANMVLELNPFIYKGYCYDSETGLYLLTTRYYNPQWGRFLNADDVSYLDPESISGLNLFAYCGNNPVMYFDPLGNFAISTFLIMVGVGLLAGGTIGGISAGINGTNVLEGIGKGMLAGGLLAASIGLTVAGIAFGIGTIGGSMMFSYGLSVTANMLEVAVTQGKKSHYDGDNFGAEMNDVVNAMFANSGRIAAGNLSILGLNIVGTRILSKIPSFYNIGQIAYYSQYFKDLRTMHGGSFLQAFGISTLSYLKNPAGPFKWLGYGLAGLQVYNFGRSIFSTPDFNNSKWILF